MGLGPSPGSGQQRRRLIGSKVALGEEASRWIYNTLLLVIGGEVIRLGLRIDAEPLWRLALHLWQGPA